MRKSNMQIGAFLMAMLMVLGLLVVSPTTSASGRAAGVHVEIDDSRMINNDQVPVAANNTANVTLTVFNIGDDTDSFNISAEIIVSPEGLWTSEYLDVAGSGSDNSTLDNLTAVTLEDEGVTFNLGLMAPAFAEPLDVAIVEVTVESRTDSSVKAIETIQFIVQNWTAYIDGHNEFGPGDDYNYTLTLVNLDANMPFDASVHPITFASTSVGSGWEVLFPGTQPQRETWSSSLVIDYDLNASEELTFKVNLMLAETVQAGENVTFSIEGGCEPGGVNPPPEPSSSPLTLSFIADVQPFYKIGPLQVDKTYAMVDSTGGTATYTFEQANGDGGLRNFGNVEDTFTLTLDDSSLPAGWSANLDKATTGALAWKRSTSADPFTDAEVTITAPASQLAGTQGVVRMTATSDGDDTISTYRDLTLEISQDYAVALDTSAAQTAEALPAAKATFNLDVDNNGNGPDTVELAVDSPNGWVAELKQASVAIENVTVDPYDSETVILEVTVPATATHKDTSGDIVITATSEDGDTNDTLTFTVTAGQVFNMALEYSSNLTDVTIKQGADVELGFQLNNTGNGIDTVTLTVDAGTIDVLEITSGGNTITSQPVGPHSVRVLKVEGTLPSTLAVGDYTVTITASSGGGGTDTLTFDVTVAYDTTCANGQVWDNTQNKCVTSTTTTDDTSKDDDSPGFALGATVLALLAGLGIGLRRRH